MTPDRSSRTAQLAAFARTAHFKERRTPKGTDHLAERFLDPGFAMLAKSWFVLEVARRFYEQRVPGAYAFVLARTLFFDEVFRSELRSGAKQIVILGAGFDSRPYRFRSECETARIFELDFPATSLVKQAKVARLLGRAPSNVTFVPIDFNTTSLRDSLAAAGYDANVRTLFMWEGVTYYLSQAAVDAVLNLVGTEARPDSAIAFDYADARILDTTCELWGAEQGRKYVSRKGEPFTFGIAPGETTSFLAARDLVCDQDLSPENIEQRYLGEAAHTRFGRVAGYCRMALARAG